MAVLTLAKKCPKRMTSKEKYSQKWTLVGCLFSKQHDRGFYEPMSKGSAFLRLVELDTKLPIIRQKDKKQITRVQIYESLWTEISSKLISYFYNENEYQKRLKDYLEHELPAHPATPYIYGEDHYFIYVMNTESALAALAEILAYSCSEKKTPHLTSRSNRTDKFEHKKDPTYIALKKIKLMHDKGELSEHHFSNTQISEYAEVFLPNIFQRISELQMLFIANQNDTFRELLHILINDLEFISQRDDLLRERVTEAADVELRSFLFDEKSHKEDGYGSGMTKDLDYIRYRNTTGLNLKKATRNFEKTNPVFKVERMKLIRSAITDLNNLLRNTVDEKPVRNYREIRKHIHEYRHSRSIYTFGVPYKPRKR